MTVPRVLIIHGDRWARRFLSRVLEDSCDLSLAEDEAEALSWLTAERFDVVLSDVHVAASGAAPFAATLEATSPGAEVILVAGAREGERCEDLRACGVLECLPDAFDPDSVTRALQRAIDRKALRAEIERLREELHRARDGQSSWQA
ncbi:response regulator [Anaeromyxobacter oryzae]|uniref:Response regulatory domain-containing protein n=1 Tax=Anaeromyxobacter oryzae TaxID=2918170 RepID=A0ABM7WSE0_9BACT|nr:response regulator [Anaeromyxobacter oryzae]BDG02401.1 hypothetical protein AMOR_13970 [Anaeromyxobacter oryzae]